MVKFQTACGGQVTRIFLAAKMHKKHKSFRRRVRRLTQIKEVSAAFVYLANLFRKASFVKSFAFVHEDNFVILTAKTPGPAENRRWFDFASLDYAQDKKGGQLRINR